MTSLGCCYSGCASHVILSAKLSARKQAAYCGHGHAVWAWKNKEGRWAAEPRSVESSESGARVSGRA